MAFFEVYRGYVGLGSTTVFRTAEQAARDIEMFRAETGELDTRVKKQGGLLAQQEVYTYSVSRGRLRDIDASITTIEKDVDGLKAQIEAKVTELERLGVPNVGAMIGQSAIMIASYWIPGLAVLSFFGINPFSGKKEERKRRAEKIMQEIVKLKKEIEWRLDHRLQLIDEAKNLSAVMEQGSSADVKVALVAIPKKNVKRVYDVARQTIVTLTADVKDPYAITAAEGAKRAEMSNAGTRLPEGFQKLYSPIFRDKSIIVQNEKKTNASKTVTGHKLVYGGLAGVGESRPDVLVMYIAFLGGLWVLSQVAAPPQYAHARAR